MKFKRIFPLFALLLIFSFTKADTIITVTPTVDVTATTHTDSAVVQVAHEIGVTIDPQATPGEIVQTVVNAYSFIPNKDTTAGGWTKFILMIAGLIGTVTYYILHAVQKKKNAALTGK